MTFEGDLCEGGVDVVGVVTPLVRGGAQVFLHGDQVVELSVLLGVHEEGEVDEDGEGQVEVESEEGELKEKRSCTWMTNDTHEHLSHEVHVTRHQSVTKTTRSCVHARVLCRLRVFMFMSLYLLLMWFVSCLSSVLLWFFRL